MSLTVTVLDTGSIQPFIFGSNVLRENIGASELVHRATRLWAFEELAKLESNHNIDETAAREDRVRDMYTGKFEADGSDKVGAEVLYAGGGNTVILFQGDENLERAQEFVYRLSLRLLRDAPGLNLYAAHLEYDWGKAKFALPQVVEEAIKHLGRNKGRDPGSLPSLGFPVTAACTSTGLPANCRHPDKKGKTGSASRANRQVWAKWQMALNLDTKDDARTRLRRMFPAIGLNKEFDWADEFDELADLPERDDSYVAVVHADGNGMGAKIKALTDEWSKGEKVGNPRGYIEAMRRLSISVQETAQDALKKTVAAMMAHLTDYNSLGPNRHPIKKEYKTVNGKRVLVRSQKIFPMRPIVFGGDDVTLVCVGPWGLAVAQRYLKELEAGDSLTDDPSDKPFACAGVAIVKTHYPFSQAYELSESLLKGAKTRIRAITGGKKASALDWHYTTTGLTAELGEIRKREYQVPTGPLNMRPLMLKSDHSWRNWDNLVQLVSDFDDWQEQRNKTLRLREALRGGPVAVAEFWAIFGKSGQKLPVVPLDPRFTLDYGWATPANEQSEAKTRPVQARCVYFDAIEIADQFFELPD